MNHARHNWPQSVDHQVSDPPSKLPADDRNISKTRQNQPSLDNISKIAWLINNLRCNNTCDFKILDFGVVHYTAIDNWFTYVLICNQLCNLCILTHLHEIYLQPLDCAIDMCNYMHTYKYIYINGGQRIRMCEEEWVWQLIFSSLLNNPNDNRKF